MRKHFSIFSFLIIPFIFFFLFNFPPLPANADTASETIDKINKTIEDELSPALGIRPEGDVNEVVGSVLDATMGILGSISLLVFIYGGIMWMLSRGDKADIKKGRDTLIWASIGLFAVFAASAVIRLVLEQLSQQ